jgi:hypothetical protein
MNIDELEIAAKAIGIELSQIEGGKWELQPQPEGCRWNLATLRNGYVPEEAISISHEDRRKRFNVAVCWPVNEQGSLAPHRPYDHTGAWYSFGCSDAKTPAIIAKAIYRQLLPDYRTQLTVILDSERKRVSFESERSSLAAGISAALGILHKPRKSNHGYPAVSLPYKYCDGIGECEIEIAGENDFRLRLELNSSQLCSEILAVIKKHIDLYAIPPADIAGTFRKLAESHVGTAALAEFALAHWNGATMGVPPADDMSLILQFQAYLVQGHA